MRVLRENLDVRDYQTLTISNHAGARILSVAPGRCGGERVDVWWLDPEMPAAEGESSLVDVGIYIVGTGHLMPRALTLDPPWMVSIPPVPRFIGTCVMPSDLVWHVFQGPVRT